MAPSRFEARFRSASHGGASFRQLRRTVGVLTAALFTASMGCRGNGGESDPGSRPRDEEPPSAPNSDTIALLDDTDSAVTDCNAHASTVCAAYQECTPFYFARTVGTLSRCIEHLAAACDELKRADAPISKTLCDSALQAGYCQAFLGGVIAPECWQPPGRAQNGAACAQHADCSSLFCDRKGECGTCAPRGAEGAACLEDRSCEAGLFCNASECRPIAPEGTPCDEEAPCGANGACIDGACHPPVNEGQACTAGTCDALRGVACDEGICTPVLSSFDSPCTPENSSQSCSSGSECVLLDADSGMCLPAARIGDSCTGDPLCLQPAHCAGTCTAIAAVPTSCN